MNIWPDHRQPETKQWPGPDSMSLEDANKQSGHIIMVHCSTADSNSPWHTEGLNGSHTSEWTSYRRLHHVTACAFVVWCRLLLRQLLTVMTVLFTRCHGKPSFLQSISNYYLYQSTFDTTTLPNTITLLGRPFHPNRIFRTALVMIPIHKWLCSTTTVFKVPE